MGGNPVGHVIDMSPTCYGCSFVYEADLLEPPIT
uniref:TOPII n=1 Tax=Arundo donax TaxID=35708 RepID=A0A0A8ZJF4_ARUDO